MTPDEIDQQLAILATLMSECKARDEALRVERRKTLRPGQRSPVVLPGADTELAWVSMTKPSKGGALTASVTDLDALVRWCREHRPSALTETVRTSDQAAILAQVKETGEVVPGVELSRTSPGSAQLRVNVEAGAFDGLLEAVRDGRVDALKAITGSAA